MTVLCSLVAVRASSTPFSETVEEVMASLEPLDSPATDHRQVRSSKSALPVPNLHPDSRDPIALEQPTDSLMVPYPWWDQCLSYRVPVGSLVAVLIPLLLLMVVYACLCRKQPCCRCWPDGHTPSYTRTATIWDQEMLS